MRAYDYIRSESPLVAELFVQDVDLTVQRLGDFPMASRRGPMEGTRRYDFRRWRKYILYRPHENGLDVVVFRDARQQPITGGQQ